MLLACLSAACWSLITPPFQLPDEPSHFAYAQQLAETGRPPSSSRGLPFSPEVMTALTDLHQSDIRQRPQKPSLTSQAEQRRLESDLAAPLGRTDDNNAGVAASQPPLYYTLMAIPYGLGASENLLARLELMRLLSALMAGLTALFTFLFVREALPGVRWAWTVGGLSVAFVPLLGFMSGAVNPDAMLFAVSAALFYCLARAFRHGLTLQSACTIGAVIAIGLLTKLNFIGLLPGAILGLVLLARSAAQHAGRTAYKWLAAGLAIAAAPAVLYAFVNLISNHSTLGVVSVATNSLLHHGSIFDNASYLWQLYLPRLPGMPNDFPGYFPTRQAWFNGYVGLYGWLDTTFPAWVYSVALVPATLIGLACARALLASRSALQHRLPELLTYIAISAGVMVLVGTDSYLHFPRAAAEYAEARYLLPMLPLLGAVLALAARGAGRRWGPVAGVLIVILFFGHDIFSQLQVIARFYG
jgi:4-amino-4-deoxy-L-arabinose transferase-like glycosyltransferase